MSQKPCWYVRTRGARPLCAACPNENIPKKDVFAQLEAASRDSRKGRYRKGSHSFSLLKQIDPTKVIQRSPFAKRLVDTLKAHLISA